MDQIEAKQIDHLSTNFTTFFSQRGLARGGTESSYSRINLDWNCRVVGGVVDDGILRGREVGLQTARSVICSDLLAGVLHCRLGGISPIAVYVANGGLTIILLFKRVNIVGKTRVREPVKA